MEIDKCVEKIQKMGENGATTGKCITKHPGYADVCLNYWVLKTAGIGFKTKKKKSYCVKFAHGDTGENE